MPRVPNMRHQVVVESPPDPSVTDAAGEPSNAWSTYVTTYAELMPLVGRDLLAAQQVHAEVTFKIAVRYRADKPIDATKRVRLGTTTPRYFPIKYVVNPDERKEWLHLFCSEGTRDG